MAQIFWPSHVKLIRDKIHDVIQARATADAISVGEVLAGLHGDPLRFPATGIYVLLPAYSGSGVPTNAHEGTLRFPVVVNSKAYTEAAHLDKLGELVSLIVDAIDTDSGLSGVGGAENAWVSEIREPELATGPGPNQLSATQTVIVSVDFVRG